MIRLNWKKSYSMLAEIYILYLGISCSFILGIFFRKHQTRIFFEVWCCDEKYHLQKNGFKEKEATTTTVNFKVITEVI